MNCVICKTKMDLVKVDISFGENKKEYTRSLYECKDCDVWINVEIPKKMLA